jgi:hypothetical protein
LNLLRLHRNAAAASLPLRAVTAEASSAAIEIATGIVGAGASAALHLAYGRAIAASPASSTMLTGLR